MNQPTKKSAVIYNGPPGSGKDFICKELVASEDEVVFHREFKHRLYMLTMNIYGVSPDVFWEIYNDRAVKEKPLDIFDGLSIRQAMIKVSEEAIKPVFGKDYFGRAAANSMLPGLNVFSDGGFIEELEPVYEATEGNLLIVRIHADGCDFKSDSRNYIQEFKDVPIIDIHNDMTSDFVYKCIAQLAIHFRKDENQNYILKR